MIIIQLVIFWYLKDRAWINYFLVQKKRNVGPMYSVSIECQTINFHWWKILFHSISLRSKAFATFGYCVKGGAGDDLQWNGDVC